MRRLQGLWVCLLCGGAMWAADVAAPQDTARRVYTVTVDARTGKLVRAPAGRYSRPVASRIVATRPVPAASSPENVVKARVVEAQTAGSAAEAPRPQPVLSGAAYSFDKLVEQVALQYQIHPSFVHAVIKAESNYNPRAVSPKGALGLMQLMPQTARRFGVSNVFNPAENLQGGIRFLRYLLDLYADQPPAARTALSLAAYNAGESSVGRFGGVPPYLETRHYIRRVTQLYHRYYTPATPEPAPKKLEGPRIFQTVDASGVTRYTTESQ